MALKALIFDCDGTLAETEEAHRTAFNHAFAGADLDWHWSVDRYRELLKVTGGKERIAHFIAEEQRQRVDINALHLAKNALYSDMVRSGKVVLRPGVMRIITAAQAQGVALAIATTTSRSNLDSLIAATPLRDIDFATIVTGEDVTRKKPDPEAYHIALSCLSLTPDACIAFEDSANGLSAARRAGIATIVTPSLYTSHEDFSEANIIAHNLDDLADQAEPDIIGWIYSQAKFQVPAMGV
jgi:HAD superfamily hydrolase (TIGR01509 family)